MADPALAVPLIQFGVFTVDLRAGELRKHGTRVKLQERPFQLLVALLARSGEVVTREDLRQQLWPDGTFVDFDHSISSAINKLRAALNDSARTPRYIETVGRRGYRFIYPISAAPVPPSPKLIEFPAPPPRPMPIRMVAVVSGLALVFSVVAVFWATHKPSGAAVPPHIRSIAVLPLKNLSSDPQEEYFSEGLTDELITRLASLPGLRVISRTSAMHYKNSTMPLPQIAQQLKVDAIVEGSVLRAGGRVRITAQLIAAATDHHIWARSYERDQRDVLALQDEVTRNIAESIKLSLNPADRQRLSRARTVDPQAHESYLRGRFEWSKRSVVGFQAAATFFQRAIQRDPDYAQAYAGLADCYALIGGYDAVSPATKFMPMARAAALKALELDPNLAEAHTSLALVHEVYEWDWPAAEREYRRAIALDPNYATAHHWYSEYLMLQGRFNEALAESERARELDPLSLIIVADRGAIFLFARQYDAAEREFRSVLKQDRSFSRAQLILNVYVQKGMYDKALAQLKWWEDEGSPWALGLTAYINGRAGRQAQARIALAHLQQYSRHHGIDPAVPLIASIGMGRKEEAFAWLERAYREHSTVMSTLKTSPLLDPLRGDPRFQVYLHRAHLDTADN